MLRSVERYTKTVGCHSLDTICDMGVYFQECFRERSRGSKREYLKKIRCIIPEVDLCDDVES